ncbi:hypothetical protein BDP27DRAFT_1333308 [Rhodocollybia butyracea]|uniref:Uncharacterized protein n=1 Tax=Rhodocollybia butyracea TaxID=206335 RepID=A0A9P5U361_9AGAR|nr:hypothetical protein BDP27DRAFT_1333308 [Rhodocollybia butyracea]
MFSTFVIPSLLFSLARASPMLLSRTVFDPPVTSPNSSTVWTVGETVTATWDTSSLPPANEIPNTFGELTLGFDPAGTDSENPILSLASGFLLSAGNVSFVVPSVETRNDYLVILFGDSGNTSPTFTIEGTD